MPFKPDHVTVLVGLQIGIFAIPHLRGRQRLVFETNKILSIQKHTVVNMLLYVGD